MSCGPKSIKSSQTLQIIQSRLAIKQQLYTEALLKNQTRSNEDLTNQESADQMNTPVDIWSKKFGYLSDDDNESFVSADSVS